MLRVSAGSLRSEKLSDVFDVVIDTHGELSVVLLDVEWREPTRESIAQEALEILRSSLTTRAPMYEIVGSLRSFGATESELLVRSAVIRISQSDARVEILNAGMPAIVCALPGGGFSEHPALSAAIGERIGEVHPYELVPLSWGGTWFVTSDGLTEGERDAQHVLRIMASMNEEGSFSELAALDEPMLVDRAARARTHSASDFGDASCVIVHADTSLRFRSGIKP